MTILYIFFFLFVLLFFLVLLGSWANKKNSEIKIVNLEGAKNLALLRAMSKNNEKEKKSYLNMAKFIDQEIEREKKRHV